MMDPILPDGESEAPEMLSGGVKIRDGRLIALEILEVLAGTKSPTEASQALSVSLTRYYTLENRALEGLVAACEPQPRGPRPSQDKVLEELRAENANLVRECKRFQTLARATKRSLELVQPKVRAPRSPCQWRP